MSEVLIPEAERAVVQGQFDRGAMFRSVGLSIFVNGVLPFAVYKILAPYYPNGSIIPLLFASAFPLMGLVVGLIRTRSIDAIAIFALVGIAYGISTTLLAGEVHLALILGSTQGFLIAAVFFGSTFMAKPLMFYMVRQFRAGADPGRRAEFAAVDAADGGSALRVATLVWAAGITVQTVISLVVAFTLAPATVLLVNNIVNTGANIALVAWTIRYVQDRLERAGQRLAADAAPPPSQ